MLAKVYDVIDVMTTTGKKKPEDLVYDISSSTPSGAAGKAMTKICKKNKTPGNCIRIITVRDKVSQKVFSYKVSRERIDKVVLRDGVPILYKYSTVVRSMN